MIDINKIENEFDKYVSSYNPTNERIKLKIEHTKRVAKNCKTIANILNLTQEEINLAIAIGYFHDIGRFEQVRIANTFSDKESGINHGEMSAKVLFEDGLIKNFIDTSKYDNIIKTAILNHNRAHIEENLPEKELLFSKIIRDSDKIDILNSICIPSHSMESIFWYSDWNNEKINEDIMNDFFTNHFLYYTKIKCNNDMIPTFYAYIFNLYFPISLKIISENKYLEKYTERILEKFTSNTVHLQSTKLLEECQKYIAENIDN